MQRAWRGVVVGAVLVLTACGPGGPGGSSATLTSFIAADWKPVGNPVVTCPTLSGVLTALDGFTIVAGKDYALLVTLTQSQNSCQLDFNVTNLTGTLAHSQRCTLDFDRGASDVSFASGDLGASTDGKHLNFGFDGTVSINSDGCSYRYGGSATR